MFSTEVGLEELLKEAGFQTVEKQTDRILYASGAKDFGKAYETFVQAANKRPAEIGYSVFMTAAGAILIVHRLPSTSNEQPATEEQRDS